MSKCFVIEIAIELLVYVLINAIMNRNFAKFKETFNKFAYFLKYNIGLFLIINFSFNILMIFRYCNNYHWFYYNDLIYFYPLIKTKNIFKMGIKDIYLYKNYNINFKLYIITVKISWSNRYRLLLRFLWFGTQTISLAK